MATLAARHERLTFDNLASDSAATPIGRTDLTEVLGNLIENATRHANARIRVTCEDARSETCIVIEDDGPGIDPVMEFHVRQRGARLDGAGAAGLGLAIVQDVLDAYAWTMQLSRSPLGGLFVRIGPAGGGAAVVEKNLSAGGCNE